MQGLGVFEQTARKAWMLICSLVTPDIESSIAILTTQHQVASTAIKSDMKGKPVEHMGA